MGQQHQQLSRAVPHQVSCHTHVDGPMQVAALTTAAKQTLRPLLVVEQECPCSPPHWSPCYRWHSTTGPWPFRICFWSGSRSTVVPKQKRGLGSMTTCQLQNEYPFQVKHRRVANPRLVWCFFPLSPFATICSFLIKFWSVNFPKDP